MLVERFIGDQAITLAEWVACIDFVGQNLEPSDRKLGQIRLEEWQEHFSSEPDGLFAERLVQLGLSEDELIRYLGSKNKNFGGDKQAWQISLETIFQEYNKDLGIVRLPEIILQHYPHACFFEAFQPFLQYVHLQLETHFDDFRRKYETVPFDIETVLAQLVLNVPPYLIYTIARTLVLELNVARLEERLMGDTAEARLKHFINHLQVPENLLSLLQEYPVLARITTVLILQWVNNFAEILEHLCQDWQVLEETFGSLGSLKSINIGKGDRHHRGRSVAILDFSSGLHLVYKPRSLGVDIHFQELLTWFNTKDIPLPFRTMKLLDQKDHGWVEYIHACPCETKEQVKKFYKRQGSLIALLHLLCSYDFHFENLIAAGEHPILIDLETLFSPSFVDEADMPVSARIMADSVLTIGLLPSRIWAGKEQEGVDLSGLGMKEGQFTPHGVPTWKNAKGDEMHFARERMLITGSNNHQPSLGDDPVQLIDYVDDICEGFTQFYTFLTGLRGELSDFLKRFNNDRTRCVLRPTRTYSLLLLDSVHPDLMQDALPRDQFLDKLWVGTIENKQLRRAIPYEQEDMWHMDVPLFTTNPSSTHLWTSDGKCIEGYFDETGIDRVIKKLEQFGATDMERQLWLIRASLSTISRASHQPVASYGSKFSLTNEAVPIDQLLSVSTSICNRIQALALDLEQDPLWFGINYNMGGNFFTVNPISFELYNGLSGIAFFLTYLGKLSETTLYTRLAKRIADKLRETLRHLIETDEVHTISIGGFDGWGGFLYTLTHLGILWNDPDLLEDATTVANLVQNRITEDQAYDIISGAAGCIGALLSLYAVTQDESVLKVAKQCGDHLLANTTETQHGVAWKPPKSIVIKEPLTGFSHGVAGIAWSLLKLSEITGDEKYAVVAKRSLEYERAFFSEEHQNWRDLRDHSALNEIDSDVPIYATLWCHGAPGIGLARLDTLHLLDDANIRGEIDVAIKTTLQYGFGKGHCLCHGDLGNIELLVKARDQLGSEWDAHIQRISGSILASIGQQGWLCGNPLNVEEPGLMTGLAGIGYGLLRLAYPEQIPSVLLFEPPLMSH